MCKASGGGLFGMPIGEKDCHFIVQIRDFHGRPVELATRAEKRILFF